MHGQEMMNWHWIAGFFEGEGYVGWTERKESVARSGRGGRIAIGQKDKRPLDAIHQFLLADGFVNPRLYLRAAPTKQSGLGKASAIWMLELCRRDDVRKFLIAIRPLVFQKRDAVDRVLALVDALIAESAIDVARAQELSGAGLSWPNVAKEMHVKYIRLRNTLAAAGVRPLSAPT